MVARSRFLWRLRTRALKLGGRTRVMAIVNLTPDSFSGDGTMRDARTRGRGADVSPEVAGVAAVLRAVTAGADIVDLGAESTRPNAEPVSAEEEQARLLPVLAAVVRVRPEAIISVDTYHAATARAAAAQGAEIINDVSGLLWDAGMAAAVAKTGCGLVLMHTRGRPGAWRVQPGLAPGSVAGAVVEGLAAQLARARQAGVADAAVVVDPGFGFGKLGPENLELLANLPALQELGRPVLVGLSRKGFLGETVAGLHGSDVPAAEARRVATVAANVAAVLGGAHIVRVHDVLAAREAVAVADAVVSFRSR